MAHTYNVVNYAAPIASLYNDCIRAFNDLFNSLNHNEACEYLPGFQEELGRFIVWAENAGAHRTGRVSLDHRLREASNVKGMVIKLLEDLVSDLKDSIAIATGDVQPSDVDVEFWSSDSSVSSFEADELPVALPSGERKPSSEMADSLSDITHVITCLYEFSISIRNPAPRDRLEKCASIHVSHFEPFDIEHLSHKFPSAPEYLIERLGKANTRRRQLLMYHERHHDKIVGHHVSLPTAGQPMLLIPKQVHDQDLKEMLADGTIETPPPPKSTATATTSRKTQTTVSIYVPREQDDIDACSNTDHSQTSYATSAEASSELPKLRVPPPPKQDSTFEGDPFECPYCFTIISISGQQSWDRHVFRDLRPYVCTAKECPKSDYLFTSRHEWFQHESDIHCREWYCKPCREVFYTRGDFESHLQNQHSSLFETVHLQTLVDRCERAKSSEQPCILCGEVKPAGRLQRHLGSHMQQISLFVMRPRDEIKAGDSESMGAHIAGSDDTRGSELSCDLEFESNPSSIDEELASTHPNLLMSSQAHSEVERQSTEDSSAANTSEPSILVAAKNPHLVTSGEASTDSQPAGESDSLDFMRGGKSPEDGPPIQRSETIVETTEKLSNSTARDVLLSVDCVRVKPLSDECVELISACPRRRPVSGIRWHGVPEIQNFHICENCYKKNISGSRFAREFTESELAEGQRAFCAFNTPRVLNFIWPETTETNVFDVFEGYATKRSKIGTCTNMDASAKQGMWYMTQGISNPAEGYRRFIACQACFEDVILASPFHQFFEPLEAAVTDETTTCHVSWPFAEALLLNTLSPTWDEIHRKIDHMLLKVPECLGDKLIKDPGRQWWKPKDTVLPLYVCDCCYWDGIFPTLFSSEFVAIQDPKDALCCVMSRYQLSTVWQYAEEEEDITPWLDAANAALSPMCTFHGSTGKIWNVFTDPALDGIDFCERCADVFIRPLGFGKHLEKRRYSPDEIILCDLNPRNKYQRETLQKLGEAAAGRDFGILKNYFQLAPQAYRHSPCPGTELSRRTQWWSCERFVVCEECWLLRVKPSVFESRFEEFDPKGEYLCDLGTPEWRYIWQKRCERREFSLFLEAIMHKHTLDNMRFRRMETLSEIKEKSRRGLLPDEKRRLHHALSILEEEERDTTNMLAALTPV